MKSFVIPEVEDDELVGFHIYLMRLWDKAQSGRLECSGMTYTLLDRMLTATINEINKRQIDTRAPEYKK